MHSVSIKKIKHIPKQQTHEKVSFWSRTQKTTSPLGFEGTFTTILNFHLRGHCTDHKNIYHVTLQFWKRKPCKTIMYADHYERWTTEWWRILMATVSLWELYNSFISSLQNYSHVRPRVTLRYKWDLYVEFRCCRFLVCCTIWQSVSPNAMEDLISVMKSCFELLLSTNYHCVSKPYEQHVISRQSMFLMQTDDIITSSSIIIVMIWIVIYSILADRLNTSAKSLTAQSSHKLNT